MPNVTADITDVRAIDNGYTAIIAVNDMVDGGMPVDLSRIRFDTYMRNPVVLWNHEREMPPIGRATDLRRGASGQIEADFEFAPGDERSQRFKNLWDRGFLRGASIGWKRRSDGEDELIEWSLVSVPADRDAVRAASEIIDDDDEYEVTEGAMNDDQIRELVTAAMSAQAEQFASQMSELRESIASINVPAVAEAPVIEEPVGSDEVAIRSAAAERAELLVATRSLIADTVDTTALTNREIMTMAIGDELPDADKRSMGYLRATLDGIIERRAAAVTQTVFTNANVPYGNNGSYANGTMIRAMQRREEG